MWSLLLSVLVVQSATTADVELLNGSTVTGTLVTVSSDQVVLDVAGDKRTLDVRDLQSVTLANAAPTPPASITDWVQLVDGSRLLATRYAVSDRQVKITLAERVVPAETRSVKAIRFRPPTPELNAQWADAVAAEITGDMVVLRRDETTLDQLEGVLNDIDETTVEFEFDEELIPVKREKLEGIVYFHRAGRQLPETLCRVVERGGSVWMARSLELTADGLQIRTPADVKTVIPLAALAKLDFSSGNVLFLADVEPEAVEWVPYVGSRLPDQSLAKLYLPLRNRSFAGPELWLNEDEQVTRYYRGLAIHSRTLIVYRLSGEYRRFTAIAGIDSRLRGRGNVELVISADDRQLFRQSIRGDQPPVMLDLDVQNANRLKILVDFGQELDVADHLNLCNAKVIK
jgi:hypothetical protein